MLPTPAAVRGARVHGIRAARPRIVIEGIRQTQGRSRGVETKLVVVVHREAANSLAVKATIPRTSLEHAGWKLETIIVDNGSSDGTGQLAAARDSRVVLRQHSMSGE